MTKTELRDILDGVAARGALTPEAVVEAARDEAHPLHGQFEWDDAAAAAAHRVETARAIIRSVNYRSRVVHGRTLSVPVYVHSPAAEPREQGYVALGDVRPGSQDAAVVLRDEMARVVGAARRALAVASRVGSAELEQRLAALLAQAEGASAAIATQPELLAS